MKIRQGFVSNSSSSSFILITSVENHEKVMKEFNEEEKKILNKFFAENSKIFNRDVVVAEYFVERDGMSLISIISEEYELDVDDIYEVWDKYKELVRKNKEETFSHTIDM